MRSVYPFLTALFLGSFLHGANQPQLTTDPWAEPSRGIPLIASYDVPATRHNGEVWAFAQEASGRLWVGSDELFLFDGESRERVVLPFEAYAVRALAHDNAGRLWIGAIGEIGHLEKSDTGTWNYVSARPELQSLGLGNFRVWEALQTPEGVVFVTDDRILRWDGSRFEQWRASGSALRPNRDGHTLWIVDHEVGLLHMEANGPQLIVPKNELPSPVVAWAAVRQ